MHRFFHAGFEPLHAHVVDLLAQDGVHSLLPLLGVNREWRTLAVKRMLDEYTKTNVIGEEGGNEEEKPLVVLSEGEYILLEECCCSPYDGPFESDDPRSTLGKARSREVRTRSCPLLLVSFDPKTNICIFKPARSMEGVDFQIMCDPDHNEFRDLPRSFDFHPTGWFRHAQAGARAALHDLELAARPDRHPPVCAQGICPNVPGRPKMIDPMEILMSGALDGFEAVDVKDYEMRCGWIVSYTLSRFDLGVQDLGDLDDMVMVPCHFSVQELKVPFIDLFVPRYSTEKKGYYEGY